MKFKLDERIKHRIIGFAVLFSLGVIFLPTVMKNTNQRLDGPLMTVKLPDKPSLPRIAIPDEKALFETVKVAHVEIPSINEKLKPENTIVKAEPISSPVVELKAAVAKPLMIKPVTAIVSRYVVQLGTFSQQSNAIALVAKLKKKGYSASFAKINIKNGVAYKVIVGNVNQKQQAQALQEQLASVMQLKGFVVATGVS